MLTSHRYTALLSSFSLYPARVENIDSLPSVPGSVTSMLSVRVYGCRVSLLVCLWEHIWLDVISPPEICASRRDFHKSKGWNSEAFKCRYACVSWILHGCLTSEVFHRQHQLYCTSSITHITWTKPSVHQRLILTTCSSLSPDGCALIESSSSFYTSGSTCCARMCHKD